MPLNELKNILEKQAIKPNKLLGQIFLRDKNVLNKIISAANLTARDRVLEVGPGLGVLTRELAKHAGYVIAVEKDKNLAARLKAKFANNKNVEIIEGDILKTNIPALFCCHPDLAVAGEGSPRLGRGRTFVRDSSLRLRSAQNDNRVPYKVVANIPYYLTSHLIRLLLEGANPPQDIILMIQKQVAQRICARPPKMSLLAASVQFYAEPKIIASVAKKSFWPQPKVDSAIIRITPRPVVNEVKFTGPHSWCHPEQSEGSPANAGRHKVGDSSPTAQNDKKNNEHFFRILHAGFSHPRKQLLNNLSSGLKIPRERIIKILQTAGLKPTQRAETLKVEDWIKLTQSLPTEI